MCRWYKETYCCSEYIINYSNHIYGWYNLKNLHDSYKFFSVYITRVLQDENNTKWWLGRVIFAWHFRKVFCGRTRISIPRELREQENKRNNKINLVQRKILFESVDMTISPSNVFLIQVTVSHCNFNNLS